MTAGSLSTIARKHVTAVPRALKALAALERELSQAATCDEIRKVVDQAEAFKLLFGDIDVVEAEDVILAAGARIGEEIAKVPKANARRRITTQGKWSAGRKEALASGTQRARFQKLAAAKPDLKAIAKKLREQGKEATPTAIVRELTQGDKKESRQRREIELGARQRVLPTTKHGAILGDSEWRWEPWSRETGMDRAADNHYPTSELEKIKALEFHRLRPTTRAGGSTVKAVKTGA